MFFRSSIVIRASETDRLDRLQMVCREFAYFRILRSSDDRHGQIQRGTTNPVSRSSHWFSCSVTKNSAQLAISGRFIWVFICLSVEVGVPGRFSISETQHHSSSIRVMLLMSEFPTIWSFHPSFSVFIIILPAEFTPELIVRWESMNVP